MPFVFGRGCRCSALAVWLSICWAQAMAIRSERPPLPKGFVTAPAEKASAALCAQFPSSNYMYLVRFYTRSLRLAVLPGVLAQPVPRAAPVSRFRVLERGCMQGVVSKCIKGCLHFMLRNRSSRKLHFVNNYLLPPPTPLSHFSTPLGAVV